MLLQQQMKYQHHQALKGGPMKTFKIAVINAAQQFPLLMALAYVLSLGLGYPVYSVPVPATFTNGAPVIPASVSQSNMTSSNTAILASSFSIPFDAPSTHVTIWTSPDAAPLYINLKNTTATSANALVQPGASLTLTVSQISAITGLGTAATGKVNWVAY